MTHTGPEGLDDRIGGLRKRLMPYVIGARQHDRMRALEPGPPVALGGDLFLREGSGEGINFYETRPRHRLDEFSFLPIRAATVQYNHGPGRGAKYTSPESAGVTITA